MIHYQLRCHAGHQFDGWFQDSTGFERLARAGLVECTQCGSAKVERALMAPAIRKSRRKAIPAPVPQSEQAPAEQPEPAQAEAPPPVPQNAPERVAGGPIPAQLLSMLQRLRAEVEKSCDYVGPSFADEARRIANGKAEARGIYGEASDAEAEALSEEGIDIARLPWVPRADG